MTSVARRGSMDKQEPQVHEGEVLPLQGPVQQDRGAHTEGHQAEHGHQGLELGWPEQDPPPPTPTGEGYGQAGAAGV